MALAAWRGPDSHGDLSRASGTGLARSTKRPPTPPKPQPNKMAKSALKPELQPRHEDPPATPSIAPVGHHVGWRAKAGAADADDARFLGEARAADARDARLGVPG